ncbi:MAG: SAM-dependent methyltransferase [Deltaproteobacteria bacterium]|nr:SAM-dependent methyltransferase [Deltaproteobacteria bacterium]
MIRHQEIERKVHADSTIELIIEPEKIPFISYPYEWCFSQLKDAALATLKIQQEALQFGMTLKDSSAYNIQFFHGRPIHIDTLSFKIYQEGQPWYPYRQFCQHFLAPLVLMKEIHLDLGKILRIYTNGLPLEIILQILPWRKRLRPPIFFHLVLQEILQKFFEKSRFSGRKTPYLSRQKLFALLDHLERTVDALHIKTPKTVWTEYYSECHYAAQAFGDKEKIISNLLEKIRPSLIWSLGENKGHFSRLAGRKGISTIAIDSDAAVTEAHYLRCKKEKNSSILPLLIDLENPSPSLGWGGEERFALHERGRADALLCLALIHHLAAKGIPLHLMASYFAKLSSTLIIEFVPKEDPQIQCIIQSHEGLFAHYDQNGFEQAFSDYFRIISAHPIRESTRVIYWMQKRD